MSISIALVDGVMDAGITWSAHILFGECGPCFTFADWLSSSLMTPATVVASGTCGQNGGPNLIRPITRALMCNGPFPRGEGTDSNFKV